MPELGPRYRGIGFQRERWMKKGIMSWKWKLDLSQLFNLIAGKIVDNQRYKGLNNCMICIRR